MKRKSQDVLFLFFFFSSNIDNYLILLKSLKKLALDILGAKVEDSKSSQIIEYCFSIFLDLNYRVEHRQRVIEQVLIPFLSKASLSVLEQFFISVIPTIMGIVNQPLLKDYADLVEIISQLKMKIWLNFIFPSYF